MGGNQLPILSGVKCALSPKLHAYIPPQPELYDSGSGLWGLCIKYKYKKHGHQGCGKNLCGARCGFGKKKRENANLEKQSRYDRPQNRTTECICRMLF